MSNRLYLSIDPVFFLLHGQVDRLWAAWQAHDRANAHAIGGGLTQDLAGLDQFPAGKGVPVTADTIIDLSKLGPNTPISELFDTTGGYLCYTYDTLS